MAATFSYAQAAKGATVAQTSLAPIVSQQHSSPPSTSSQGKDDIPTEETSLTAPSVTSTDADLLVRETGKFQQADIDRAFAKRPSDLASPGASSAPSVSSAADKTRRDADATSTETVTGPDTGDKPLVAGRQQRLPENSDKRERGRKGKKGRNNDRDAAAQSDQAEDTNKEKELPKPVFTEAPPPAVNVWAQRAAKAKMTQPPLAAPAAPLSLSPSLASSDDKKTAHSEDGSPALNGSIQTQPGRDKPQRKANDFPRVSEQGAAPRRSLPRGSRATEKEGRGSEAMPPVEDSFSWPDPKSAAAAASAAEEPQRKPQDKGERGDKEGQEEASTSNKKKWVPVPFVPTVAFQTQLPPRGGKTRSAPRGGREAGHSRTNPHLSTGAGADVTSTSFAESSATTAGSATAAASKNSETRPRVGSISARTISQPPNASKQRASVDNSMPTREARRSFAFANSEQSHQVTVGAPAVVSNRRNDAVRATRNDATQAESGPVAPRIHSQDKPNGVSPKGTDHSKDMSSYVSNGVPFSGREGRPDRGRGGFRGGNRNGGGAPGGHTSQSSYSSNSQYPGQHPFRNAQQSSTYGSPPTYQGATFGPAPRGRGNNRANSNAANGRNNRAPHVPPLTTMSPIDYAVQQQQQQQQQQPYLPYLQSVYDPNLINVTRQQLEYYLSVDNLCKDTHLRKRMDTQGFVPLNFIADFKRIRTILQEFNCAPGELNPVRLACQQSTKIDYVCGDDGIERLRNSKDWEPFVLKMHEREPEARNDGPKNSIPIPRIPAHLAGIYANNVMPGYPHVLSPMAMYPGLVQDDQRFHNPVYMDGAYYLGVHGGGANGRHFLPDSQLSAAVPEFSPAAPCPLTLESMTTLADEKIPQLVMILGADGTEEDDLADKGGVASSHLNGSTPTAVNGSASKSVDGSVPQVLNGSASSKSSDSGAHEETVTNGVHHGQSQLSSGSSQAVVWITETTPPAEGPKQLYTDARRIALALREQSAPGETPREMQDLYQFWARILLRDFNASMYQEFRQFALEDASKAVPSLFGLKHLLRFYDRLIKKPGPKPWPGERAPPEIFQLHFNEAMEMNQHPKAAVGDARS